MKTIRRIYFYLVAVISVELLIWGAINLLRSIINTGVTGTSSQSLSVGIAQVIVSIPIFLIHWLVIQKDASKSDEEQTSLIRAIFLYGIQLGTLFPVVQNTLAMFNRAFLVSSGGSRATALIGQSQTTTDNSIAIVINLLLALYFLWILRKDWADSKNPANLVDLIRVYKYAWMLYGLGMMILGVQLIIQFLLQKPTMVGWDSVAGLINPTSLLVLGVPIWVIAELSIRTSLKDDEERFSLWRVVVLYLLLFAGAITTGGTAIAILSAKLKWLFGDAITLQEFLWKIRIPIGIFISFAVVWGYYLRQLLQDISLRQDPLVRQAMVRIYRYVLAFLGLAVSVTGLIALINYLIQKIQLPYVLGSISQANQISQITSFILIGLSYWLGFYIPENSLTMGDEAEAEHARRSLLRKIYLYTIVFGGVIGVMVSAGTTLFTLLEGVFSGDLSSKVTGLTSGFARFALFAILLSYHLVSLRKDSKSLTVILAKKHLDFPIALFVGSDTLLGKELSAAFSRLAPSIPLQFVEDAAGITDEVLRSRAIVLRSSSAIGKNSEWKEFLAKYTGKIIAIPENKDQWTWIPYPGKATDQSKLIALTARSFAEGQEIQPKNVSIWLILGYILGGLFVLQVLLVILSLVIQF